jgi:hypothetical protein
MVAITKLPYAYVSREVDKLYEKKIDLSDEDVINKHCEFIVTFLHACGWSEDSYIRVMMGFEPLDNLSN